MTALSVLEGRPSTKRKSVEDLRTICLYSCEEFIGDYRTNIAADIITYNSVSVLNITEVEVIRCPPRSLALTRAGAAAAVAPIPGLPLPKLVMK